MHVLRVLVKQVAPRGVYRFCPDTIKPARRVEANQSHTIADELYHTCFYRTSAEESSVGLVSVGVLGVAAMSSYYYPKLTLTAVALAFVSASALNVLIAKLFPNGQDTNNGYVGGLIGINIKRAAEDMFMLQISIGRMAYADLSRHASDFRKYCILLQSYRRHPNLLDKPLNATLSEPEQKALNAIILRLGIAAFDGKPFKK